MYVVYCYCPSVWICDGNSYRGRLDFTTISVEDDLIEAMQIAQRWGGQVCTKAQADLLPNHRF